MCVPFRYAITRVTPAPAAAGAQNVTCTARVVVAVWAGKAATGQRCREVGAHHAGCDQDQRHTVGHVDEKRLADAPSFPHFVHQLVAPLDEEFDSLGKNDTHHTGEYACHNHDQVLG